jgi:hypothetical protein
MPKSFARRGSSAQTRGHHRDKSQSPEFTVGIDGKADICGQAVSAEPVANDPVPTLAGLKSRSAAVSCYIEVCYPFG